MAHIQNHTRTYMDKGMPEEDSENIVYSI